MKLYKLIYFILAVIFAKCKHTMKVAASPSLLSRPAPSTKCGGTLTEAKGIIQTPNFPNQFPIPMTCVWIIDASAFMDNPNASIIVYLTQQFALNGLIFKEYMYYSDDYKVPSQTELNIKEENVTQIAYVRSSSPFLEIKFYTDSLYGTNLRVMNHLLDIYGFNITYEIDTFKSYQCNSLRCSFLGNCYASYNFSSYYCDCFPGYSGKDCSQGPLCRKSKYCKNGGTCKYVGDSIVTCSCLAGFKGSRCELHDIDNGSDCNLSNSLTTNENDSSSYECYKRCLQELKNDELCRCNQNSGINRGKARFEATVRLGNATLFVLNENGEKRVNQHYKLLLEKHITRFLRNSNISRISDLEIFSKTMSASDVTFHFFGSKTDSTKVRDAINKMVEKGRIGNFSLISTHYALHQEPGLTLQAVEMDHKNPIRENSDIVLSCIAQGSTQITFKWYKNGYYLNTSLTTSNKIWTQILPVDSKGFYTALLGITRTDQIDNGIYTCQVLDWGMQFCKSTKVEVLEAPQIRVDPPNVTLYRGGSVRVRCLTNNLDELNEKIGYSWTKNNALFQSDPNLEMWEDLYPDGSILTISNIHKSAIYACTVTNAAAQVTKEVKITVVDRDLITLCPEEKSYGMRWPASSSGPPIFIECPQNYQGQAQRICEQQDYKISSWLMPDFSDCINQDLVRVTNEFKELTYGLQRTNASTILRSCLEYAMNHYEIFLPGEGGYLLKMLQNIYEYSRSVEFETEREITYDLILKIIDIILLNETSLNKQMQVKQLQDLVQLIALKRESTTFNQPISVSGSGSSSSGVSTTSTSVSSSAASTSPTRQLKSLQIYKETIKSLPYSLRIFGDQLFSNQLYLEVDVSTTLIDAISNGTVTVSVISYRNLTHFLPRMYSAHNNFGTDINYVPASKIISSWLFYANQSNESAKPLHLPLNTAHVEIIFQHEHSPNNEWIPLCGYDSKATFEPSWRTDACITENLMENITRCICPLSGTFVVLLVKKSYSTVAISKTASPPIFIIISCGCCFLQSTIAFIILLPNIYIRKCYISFLKMQFCSSVSTTMAFLILGLLKLLPQDWYGVINSGLTAVLLLGSSTLVAIILIIQTELEMQTSSILTPAKTKLSIPSSSSMKKMSIKTATTLTSAITPTSNTTSTTGNTSPSNTSVSSSIKKQMNQHRKQKSAVRLKNLATANGIKSIIGLSWLLPILCAMCIPLIHNIIGYWPDEWWLQIQTLDFTIFVIIQVLFVFLFMMLFVTLMKKLIFLSKRFEKLNNTLRKRIGLLNRIAVLFVTNLLSHTFYIIYLNTTQYIVSYLFGTSSILLGLLIIFCFIIKVENYSISETTSSSSKSSIKNSLDDFCTSQINNPLNFYTSQDMEKDNKCIPMKVYSSSMSYPIDVKAKATTILQNTQQITSKMHSHAGSGHGIVGGDVQTTSEIIDLALTATTIPPTTSILATNSNKNIDSSNLCNINAKARTYELQKINNKMINIYDESQSNINSTVQIPSTGMMPGCYDKSFSSCSSSVIQLASTSGTFNQKDQLHSQEFSVNSLDILNGITNDTIVVIRDNNLDSKKNTLAITSPPEITLTNSEGKRACDSLVIDNKKVPDSDGMLNLISNDLDYLLNRTQEVPGVIEYHDIPPPPPPAAFSQSTKPTSTLLSSNLHHDVILEESEHEIDS